MRPTNDIIYLFLLSVLLVDNIKNTFLLFNFKDKSLYTQGNLNLDVMSLSSNDKLYKKRFFKFKNPLNYLYWRWYKYVILFLFRLLKIIKFEIELKLEAFRNKF